MGFSELTEKGRSLRTKKLFLRKKVMVKGNLTSQLLFLWNLSKPSDLKRRQRAKSMRFRERLRRNKKNLQTPSTAGSVENADDDNSQPLVVKLDLNRGKKTTSRKRISRGSPGPIKR